MRYLIISFLLINDILRHKIATCDITCVGTEFKSLVNTFKNCQNIIIKDVYVPAGQTLLMDLHEGTTVNFKGTITFGFANWVGPLIRVYGSRVTVQGERDHVLNGQGELYWDSLGSWGSLKPKFMIAQVTNGSIFRSLNIHNAPMHGISINNSHDVTFTNFLIDNAAGAENVAPYGRSGHNTDGFGVNQSTNVVIRDSTIFNQDDCVVLNSGSNILVTNVFCYGSHGLSLSVGFRNDSIEMNTLSDVIIENSSIIDAMNGIHIKTHNDAGRGHITNVTYRNIVILGSYNYGISIEQNYTNRAVAGIGATPANNVPIRGLTFSNVKGVVLQKSLPYYIVCAKDGCFDWKWEDVNIYGQLNSTCVNFHPDGISCVDHTV